MDIPIKVHGAARPTATQVRVGDDDWFVPEEVPIAFVYNRRNYAVMMGTPDDLVDFALGFSLTEGVIKAPSEIESCDIYLSDKGADLRLAISEKALERLDITQRRRNMVGASSCGLCGLENADMLFKVLPKVSDVKIHLDAIVLESAMAALGARQKLNQLTRSVHAAAWVSDQGHIELIREDVGRHNALDKLLGAMALAGTDISTGFVLMSSRCSYEIVEKAAQRGVRAILSISGPTAFALRKANEANMTIYARTEDGRARVVV